MDGTMAPKSSTSPELPPEIIRHVLRFFSHDREALRACALVSQEWLFESRPFLFRYIDILCWGPYDHFVSDVLHSDNLRPWLTSIHHLSLGFLKSGMEAFMVEISEHLSNLHTMKWTNFTPQTASFHADLFPALGQFAFLHQLKLAFCMFPSFGDLKNVVVALPYLSSLTIDQVDWNDSIGDSMPSSLTSPQLRPRLSKLAITPAPHQRARSDALFHWLSTTPTRSTLRDLWLDLNNMASALRMIGRSPLRELTVRLEGIRRFLGETHAQCLRYFGNI